MRRWFNGYVFRYKKRMITVFITAFKIIIVFMFMMQKRSFTTFRVRGIFEVYPICWTHEKFDIINS